MPVSRQELERHVVRLVAVTSLDCRQRRSVSWNVPAPVPPSGWRVNAVPRLRPPRPAVARAGAAEMRRRVRRSGCDRVRELVPDAARQDDADGEARERDDERERPPRRARSDAGVPAAGSGGARTARGADEHAAPASTTSAKTQPSCARTRARLAVARDPRQRERDAEDGRRRRRRRARAAAMLSTRSRVEHDPGRGGEARERDAEARVREQQRDDERVEQHDARRRAGARRASHSASGTPATQRSASMFQ